MSMKQIIFILISLVIGLTACNPQAKIAGNYNYDPECLGAGPDGKWTVRSFGKGKDKAEALQVAQRRALEEMLFKGIRKGVGCDQRPVCGDPTVQEKERDYFNRFFSANGPYQSFVMLKPNSFEKRMEVAGESNFMFGFELIIDYEKLKERIKTDILNKQ